MRLIIFLQGNQQSQACNSKRRVLFQFMSALPSACQVCGSTDQDMRHATIDTWYDIQEFIPEAIKHTILKETLNNSHIGRQYNEATAFTIVCCKRCRANFHRAVKRWFYNIPTKE